VRRLAEAATLAGEALTRRPRSTRT
jgi:uncharacterized membrane protein